MPTTTTPSYTISTSDNFKITVPTHQVDNTTGQSISSILCTTTTIDDVGTENKLSIALIVETIKKNKQNNNIPTSINGIPINSETLNGVTTYSVKQNLSEITSALVVDPSLTCSTNKS